MCSSDLFGPQTGLGITGDGNSIVHPLWELLRRIPLEEDKAPLLGHDAAVDLGVVNKFVVLPEQEFLAPGAVPVNDRVVILIDILGAGAENLIQKKYKH